MWSRILHIEKRMWTWRPKNRTRSLHTKNISWRGRQVTKFQISLNRTGDYLMSSCEVHRTVSLMAGWHHYSFWLNRLDTVHDQLPPWPDPIWAAPRHLPSPPSGSHSRAPIKQIFSWREKMRRGSILCNGTSWRFSTIPWRKTSWS